MVRLADLAQSDRDNMLKKIPTLPKFTARPWVTGAPLKARRVAIVTTAGLHTRGDRPFGAGAMDYRVIPGNAQANDLVMSHMSVNFDRTGFQQDWNVAFPLDRLRELHEHQFAGTPDAEISGRFSNYEMAFRLQTSVPEVTDLKDEPAHVVDSYGPDARTPGTYAYNCLLARRLAERGVRFIQLYHRGWDHHDGIQGRMIQECKKIDQPCAGLLRDLKQRGLLKDTLVIWSGEFGRTPMAQGDAKSENYGRDHQMRAFTSWVAGGGFKAGAVHGATDEFGYNVVDRPVHVHDLHATMLHLLGIDHLRLTFKYQAREHRLTDIAGKVVPSLLA